MLMSVYHQFSAAHHIVQKQLRYPWAIQLNFISAFQSSMSERLQKQLLQHLFQHFIVRSGGNSFYSFVKHDFIEASVSAMRVLYDEGKHNLVYHISRCFNREHEGAQ